LQLKSLIRKGVGDNIGCQKKESRHSLFRYLRFGNLLIPPSLVNNHALRWGGLSSTCCLLVSFVSYTSKLQTHSRRSHSRGIYICFLVHPGKGDVRKQEGMQSSEGDTDLVDRAQRGYIGISNSMFNVAVDACFSLAVMSVPTRRITRDGFLKLVNKSSPTQLIDAASSCRCRTAMTSPSFITHRPLLSRQGPPSWPPRMAAGLSFAYQHRCQ